MFPADDGGVSGRRGLITLAHWGGVDEGLGNGVNKSLRSLRTDTGHSEEGSGPVPHLERLHFHA